MTLTLFKTIQFTTQITDYSQHAYACVQTYTILFLYMYAHIHMYAHTYTSTDVRMTCMLQMCRSLTQETLALSKVQTCL